MFFINELYFLQYILPVLALWKTDYVAVATITWTDGATSGTTSLTGVTTETPGNKDKIST